MTAFFRNTAYSANGQKETVNPNPASKKCNVYCCKKRVNNNLRQI